MSTPLPLAPDAIVRGACPHDCPDTCATLVTVEGGRAVRIAGDPAHPVTQGFLCAKVNRYLERTYHPDRLTTPLRRVGAKGRGQFAPIGWDEALDEIAARLGAIAASPDGPEAILPYSYAGTMGTVQGGSVDRRFFNAIGASRLDRTICSAAGEAGFGYTVGAKIGTDSEQVVGSDLVILWGTNTLTSNPHLWPFLLEARRRGTRLLCIDPIRTRTAEQCDEWIGIRPGTDAALALGIMHVLFAEGLADEDYLARHTVGASELRARAAEYPPARVAEITGLEAARIVSLGIEYGRARAGFIRVNYGLQRHFGGGMAVRTIACLPAVAGHWRSPAGGVQLSTSAHFRFDQQRVQMPELVPGGRTPRTINMIRLGDALTLTDAGAGGPPVRALVVYNSNPAAVAPDLGAVRRGLAREDLFTVVLEHFQTDTADWADIVLPATTQLEHWDVHLAYGHHYLTLNRPAIAPLGQARPNSEIFRGIARRMGLGGAAFEDDDVTIIRQALWEGRDDAAPTAMRGLRFDRLLEHGWLRLNLATPYAPFAEGGFPTPSGKCELYSAAMAAAGLDPLPTFTPPLESAESAPDLAARYPLTLVSSPRHQFLNSTFVNVPSLSRNAEPECVVHPHDAGVRGIETGTRVRLFNDRGAFVARARVGDGIRPGVVWAPSIWWSKLAGDGRNANDTTSQQVTDMGNGPVFYDNLVQLAVADDATA